VRAVPYLLAGALVAVYLIWIGLEMGARVRDGHALLLAIFGSCLLALAALLLGSRFGK